MLVETISLTPIKASISLSDIIRQYIALGEDKISCIFYADDGILLVKSKEEARRKIRIVEEIGRRFGMEVNRRKSQCLVYNGREEMDQIEGIEVVKEMKYPGVMINDGKNVFDRQISGKK